MSQTRYWIARLKPLARPRIGLLLSLGMVGMFAWTAWQYPELMSFTGINGSEERTAEDAENAENDAIGAEIDSLSLLSKETRNLPTVQPSTMPKNDAGKPQAPILSTNFLGTNFLGTNTFPILGAGPTLNFLDPATNTLPNSLANSTNSTNLPNSAGATNDRTRTVQGTQPFSIQPDPQPSAPTVGSWSQFPQPPNQGSTGLPTSGLPMPTVPNQGSTGFPSNTTQSIPNAYTTLTNPSPYSLPIDAGVAPAVNPGIVVPVNGPIAAPVVPQVLPGADVPLAPIQPDPPFTAPRPLPGRFIGGGNINTFSNP